MSGAITEVAKKRPVKVITSRPLVFWGNPYIKSVHGLDDRRLFEDVIKGNDYIELESRINGLEILETDDFIGYIDYPVNKCLMAGDHETLEIAKTKLEKKYNGLLSIYYSEPFFLEIMPQNVDKAQSLLTLLNTIGIDSDEMICCGDGFNDISMIEVAGLGVAMENAQDIVKSSADYITLSNDDEGILHVINKFMND